MLAADLPRSVSVAALLCVALVVSPAARAQATAAFKAPPPKDLYWSETVVSPDRRHKAININPRDPKVAYTVEVQYEGKTYLIWRYPRHVDLYWSPSSRLLAIQSTDGAGDVSYVVVFRLDAGKAPVLAYQSPYSPLSFNLGVLFKKWKKDDALVLDINQRFGEYDNSGRTVSTMTIVPGFLHYSPRRPTLPTIYSPEHPDYLPRPVLEQRRSVDIGYLQGGR